MSDDWKSTGDARPPDGSVSVPQRAGTPPSREASLQRRRTDPIRHRPGVDPDWRAQVPELETMVGARSSVDHGPSGAPTTRVPPSTSAVPSPAAPLPDGVRGSSRYTDLGARLGKGGQGVVTLAYDRKLQRKVAVKAIRVQRRGDQAPTSEETLAAGHLLHPNILTVLDAFWSEDGTVLHLVTPYVPGPTLQEVIEEAHEGRPVWPVHRLVALLVQVCQAVGHAHQLGLTHRDIKSDNVLVARSELPPGAAPSSARSTADECFVIDWGLAGPAAEADDPTRSWSLPVRLGGTIALMAPEIADGSVAASTTADVYSLGCMLFEILERRRPYAGAASELMAVLSAGPPPPAPRDATPSGLAAICQRCMDPDPARRFSDALALAHALIAWQGRAERLHVADRAFVQARRALSELRRLERHLDRETARLRELRRAVHARSTDTERATVWQLEEEVATLTAQTGGLDAIAESHLQAALRSVDDHVPSRRLIARRLARRLETSAELHPAEVRRLEVALEAADHLGVYGAQIAGLGAVVLHTDRPARVEIRPIERKGNLLVEGAVVFEGPTPLVDHPLPHGGYRVTLTALDDGARCVVPIRVDRGRTARLDPRSPERPLVLPRPGTIGPDEVFVPHGPTLMGGDPRAQGDRLVGRHEVWVPDDLAVRRHLTTVGEWCRFLTERLAQGARDDIDACVPRTRGASGSASAPILEPDPRTGRFRPVPDAEQHTWQLDWPIFSVPHHAILRFLAWRSERDGMPWRLPREDEWARIARGADGRPFPWGHGYEPGWAALLDAQPPGAQRLPFRVGSHPRDCSPFGPVLDLSGGLMERMGHAHEAEPRIVDGRLQVDPVDRIQAVRGGTWFGAPGKARLAGRTSCAPDSRSTLIGFRMVRTLPSR